MGEDYYVKCALPVGNSDIRTVLHFYLNENLLFVDQQGNTFKIEPFESSEYLLQQPETAKENHIVSVQKAVEKIRNKELDKVIMSKIRHVPRNAKLLDDVFEDLQIKYPSAFVYSLNHPEYGMWIGASPELLLEKRGSHFKTVSLAGTQPANAEKQYEWNEKLIEEQRIVSEFIADSLTSQTVSELMMDGPKTLEAGPITHLQTKFSFVSNGSAEDIARVLHPTPAICGMPRDIAKQVIHELEEHQRKLYTGFLGIDYVNGDADYFVNLRCMQIFPDHFELFLGGGITASSDAEAEWIETEHKAQVLIPYLG